MKNYTGVEALISEFGIKKSAIAVRLLQFSQVEPHRYFYELCYCLMTPQSSAVNAGKAQQMLEAVNFHSQNIDPTPYLFQPDYYIRFHKTKGMRLLEMKEKFAEIEQMLLSQMPAVDKREWLVKNVKGLGDKEATHFLRNIGKNDGLCILDRHILKNLRHHRVIRSIPATLTRKRYRLIERAFRKFALNIGITVDELDLLFWSRETGEILK